MKLILGLLLGALTASAYLYASAAYYFSDYFVSEKISATAELQDTVVALEKLQKQLSEYPELHKADVCSMICKNSQYQMLYGSKVTNKVLSLSSYLQQAKKKAAQDPGFLLDLMYVDGSMSPIENSGFFTWLREIPREEIQMEWKQKATLSSRLAMTAPKLALALKDARVNTRRVDALTELRRSCSPKNQGEVVAACSRSAF